MVRKLDTSHDVVSGADSTKSGKVFVDRHIPKKFDKYLAVHERAESKAMSMGMSYRDAHVKVATPAERAAVRADGLSWKKYEEEINGYLSRIEHEKATRAPKAKLHVNPGRAIK